MSAAQVIPDHAVGDYRDLEALRAVAARLRGAHLRPRARADRATSTPWWRTASPCRPGPAALVHAQDKARDARRGWPSSACPARATRSVDVGRRTSTAFGFPCVLKTARGGYDGKGVWFVARPRTARRPFDGAGRRRPPARRGAGRLPARALGPGGARSPAARPRRTRSWSRVQRRRHLPRGRRPGAGPRPRRWPARRSELALRIAGELGRHRRPRGRAVRDHRRPGAGQRAGDAAAQHRPLDPGRRGHLAVREPPARRARPAARLAGAARRVDGDGQHPRRRPRRSAGCTTATRTRWPATRGCGSTSTARTLRPGRKVGHVNAYGDDLEDCLRARAARGGVVRGRPGDDDE